MTNSKDDIKAQKCVTKKRSSYIKQFNKANELPNKKRDNAVQSYKLLITKITK